MKTQTLGLLAATILIGSVPAQTELVRGEDRIDRPEIAAGLFLHNYFQSGMMLQRDKPIKVWGWANPDAAVSVTLGGKTMKTTAAKDRIWSVSFEPLAASAEPISLKVEAAGESISHDNILVGDLWVLGGQSNMEFPIANVENGQLEIVSANFPQIRILSIPSGAGSKTKSNFPLIYEWSDWSGRHFRKGFWDVCSPETVKELSAIGYVFGRRLHMATQVPIGIIDTSIGGTTVEAWTPLEPMQASGDPDVKAMLAEKDAQVAAWDPEADLQNQIKKYEKKLEELQKQGKDPGNLKKPVGHRPGPREERHYPGNLFASIIAPLKGIEVKGAIFHQGFNNCFQGSTGARMYGQVFPMMIKGWRENFNNPEMPFCVLSLCTTGDKQTEQNYLEQMIDFGPYIRDAQYKTYLNLRKAGDKNIGYVSTYDLGRRFYHPHLKVPAGERAARWALATQYGYEKQLQWEPPVLTEVKPVDGVLQVKFSAEVANVDDGTYMKGFAIAGEDASFQLAKAEYLESGKDAKGKPVYNRSVLLLSSPLVPKPVHFRYAWGRNPMANMQLPRNSDVPLPTLRSDDWDMEDLPQHEGDEPANTRLIRKKMHEEDLKRLKYEAKLLLEASN